MRCAARPCMQYGTEAMFKSQEVFVQRTAKGQVGIGEFLGQWDVIGCSDHGRASGKGEERVANSLKICFS